MLAYLSIVFIFILQHTKRYDKSSLFFAHGLDTTVGLFLLNFTVYDQLILKFEKFFELKVVNFLQQFKLIKKFLTSQYNEFVINLNQHRRVFLRKFQVKK